MWMVVYVAQSKEHAEKIREALQRAKLLVKIRATGHSENDKFGCYEIMVPEAELDEAHGIIISQLDNIQ